MHQSSSGLERDLIKYFVAVSTEGISDSGGITKMEGTELLEGIEVTFLEGLAEGEVAMGDIVGKVINGGIVGPTPPLIGDLLGEDDPTSEFSS